MKADARPSLKQRLASFAAVILAAAVLAALPTPSAGADEAGPSSPEAVFEKIVENARSSSREGGTTAQTNGAGAPTASQPLAPTTNQILGDSGFELGSPNPYWFQGSDGQRVIKQTGSAHTGSSAGDLCRNESSPPSGVDNCVEGLLQFFGAPSGVTSASMSLWYQATSEEFEPGECFDGFFAGLADSAGTPIDPSWDLVCVTGPTGWTQVTFSGVAETLQAYEGETLTAFIIFLTDFSYPSAAYVDDFTLSVTTDPPQPPDAPLPVVATAQDSSAYVTWERPAMQGSSQVTEYEVTSSPATTTQTVTDHRGVRMTGLTNDTPYTFNVKATNVAGQGDAASSGSVTPSASLPSGPFVPVTPTRILDTRDGTGGFSTPIPANSGIDVQITGAGPVPTSTVAAAVLNVTATEPQQGGYLTVFPKGVAQPLASNLNFSAGQTVPNQVEVALGDQGKVRIFNGSSGTVEVIADVQGYVSTTTSGTEGLFKPLPPDRILDTRDGTGGFSLPIPANSSINVQVTGEGGVPTSTVDAVIMNATVTQPEGNGFLTIFPTGETQPVVSNVNFVGGQTVPNRLHVPVGTSGEVTIFNGSPGTVHVIADVNGWFTDGSDAGATGGLFKGVTPSRIADTRLLTGAPYSWQTLMGGDTLLVKVAAQGGVPAMGDSTPPSAVVLNVTIVQPSHPGFLTVFPSNVAQPTISDLNWVPGDVRPNLVVVKLAPDGTIKLFNGSSGYLDVVVDVVGWYS